jgi:hypothetical protein
MGDESRRPDDGRRAVAENLVRVITPLLAYLVRGALVRAPYRRRRGCNADPNGARVGVAAMAAPGPRTECSDARPNGSGTAVVGASPTAEAALEAKIVTSGAGRTERVPGA